MQSWADGDGGTMLGSAQVSGGGGTAVVVSHGRAQAPFAQAITADAVDLCSDYYDFFTVGGTGL